MTMTDMQLLDGIVQMAEQAPGLGICELPFRVLHTRVAELVAEKDQLLKYRIPTPVLPYTGHLVDGVGVCPHCNAVFLDKSTPYCGNCGTALKWE